MKRRDFFKGVALVPATGAILSLKNVANATTPPIYEPVGVKSGDGKVP